MTRPEASADTSPDSAESLSTRFRDLRRSLPSPSVSTSLLHSFLFEPRSRVSPEMAPTPSPTPATPSVDRDDLRLGVITEVDPTGVPRPEDPGTSGVGVEDGSDTVTEKTIDVVQVLTSGTHLPRSYSPPGPRNFHLSSPLPSRSGSLGSSAFRRNEGPLQTKSPRSQSK